MQRFFVEDGLDDTYIITDISWIHQLSRVLRSRTGDAILLFCADGQERIYTIDSIEKKRIILGANGKIIQNNTKQKHSITLYQSLPNKYEKGEYIIQKATEIGVEKIVFFRSSRSQQGVPQKKWERWKNITKESTEQCGGYQPTILEYREDISQIDISNDTKHIVLHTKGVLQSVQQLYDANQEKYGIWIGPEGGWSEQEIKEFEAKKGCIIRFGERVLRTETAGIVVAFALLYGFGE